MRGVTKAHVWVSNCSEGVTRAHATQAHFSPTQVYTRLGSSRLTIFIHLVPSALPTHFSSFHPLFLSPIPPDVCSPGIHTCQQVCIPTNNRRSFWCLCLPGYLLNPDGTSCRGERFHMIYAFCLIFVLIMGNLWENLFLGFHGFL